MVKVTIEVAGEKVQTLTGEMVNASIIDDNAFKIACVSKSKEGVAPDKFIKSLVGLVNHAIKSYAVDDISYEMLHALFAMDMRDDVKRRISDESKPHKQKEDTKSGDGITLDLMEILRKAVEE